MSEFSDFNELYEPLVLPINGKKYTIPPVSFDGGVKINGIVDGAEKLGDEEFLRLLLGDMFDQMRADNVPSAAMNRAAQAALGDFKFGRSIAETMWKTGGDPKAIQELITPKPNRAARRSKGTAAANKTP